MAKFEAEAECQRRYIETSEDIITAEEYPYTCIYICIYIHTCHRHIETSEDTITAEEGSPYLLTYLLN